ncbi:MAG TPA: hypothetical protein VMZ92_02425 [Planctomycetota bacterium]|nr:hypothetical protein [Planctomycetota bacterium]
MKFEDISTDMMRRAIDIYVSAAYANVPVPLMVKSRIALCEENAGEGLRGMLSHKVVERVASGDDSGVIACYAVRLGNEKYPHMKLALRREPGGDDYRFVVDAHDHLFELARNGPDAPRAHELREYNRRLKDQIETRWREADLPTLDAS